MNKKCEHDFVATVTYGDGSMIEKCLDCGAKRKKGILFWSKWVFE